MDDKVIIGDATMHCGDDKTMPGVYVDEIQRLLLLCQQYRDRIEKLNIGMEAITRQFDRLMDDYEKANLRNSALEAELSAAKAEHTMLSEYVDAFLMVNPDCHEWFDR